MFYAEVYDKTNITCHLSRADNLSDHFKQNINPFVSRADMLT